jgi:hypothetical protein
MSVTTATQDKGISVSSRPVQILPWSQKDDLWFKQNLEYYIAKSNFMQPGTSSNTGQDLDILYGVYNNKFPLEWFSHITNPLSAKKKEHKAFPAKIRPVTILRTNIDLLLGEYPRRPFIYNVENLGDTGYNRYTEGMMETARQTLTEHFLRGALEQMQANGQELTDEQMQQLQQDPPVPEAVKKEFQASFKDLIAIKGQKWLRRIIAEQKVKKKLHKGFKDWLIAGQVYSYKGIQNDQLVYKKVSPKDIKYDKSTAFDFIEDGEWAVHRDMLTLSDVVDQFYNDLQEQHHKDLENKYQYATPMSFHDHLKTIYNADEQGKIPVYHVQWKGRKKIGFLSYLDMETFQMVEDVVDENYVIDREKGEQVEWRWVNEVYEGFRIGDDIYTGLRACPIQRNEMNNHSTCKLSYNGRKYSDTHSDNISVLEMGIPFQILYIIISYTLEKTIAKSKGKILLIDQNAIPDEDEWDEEKFFYYAEGLGYGLLNRNQIGVDKTWNQYQVVDMSLFDQIKQLIDMQQHLKQEWDDIIGINRQRKGQTYASDGQGVNERAAFQSTVITDMIFVGYEEFAESELQGFLDLAKFLTSKGVYGTYNDDELGTQLMEIFPEDFMNEDLGVFVERASEQIRKLEEMRSYAQAMLQNDHKPSTVLEIIDAINVSELKTRLKQIEAIDAQIEQQNAANEQEAEAAADERKKMFMEYEKLLERENMHAEYQEKQDLEMVKGTFNTLTFTDGDSNNNGVPDAADAQKLIQQQQKMQIDHQDKTEKRNQEQQKIQLKKQELDHKISDAKEKNKLTKESNQIARKKAAQKPKPAAKKK